jgi:2,5-diketo-D-gluconate reductase A
MESIRLNNAVEMPALGLGVFQTSPDRNEMAAIDGLDTGHRGGPDPNDVTLDTDGREIPEP